MAKGRPQIEFDLEPEAAISWLLRKSWQGEDQTVDALKSVLGVETLECVLLDSVDEMIELVSAGIVASFTG